MCSVFFQYTDLGVPGGAGFIPDGSWGRGEGCGLAGEGDRSGEAEQVKEAPLQGLRSTPALGTASRPSILGCVSCNPGQRCCGFSFWGCALHGKSGPNANVPVKL